MNDHDVRLGLGLIRIGKPWGFMPAEVPGEKAARELLETALDIGISAFDTAASYGRSEVHLGNFLSTLTLAQRAGLVVGTKFGEHWDDSKSEPYVDHSLDGLRRSVARSLSRLGRIDVLQLHKTTPDVLRSDGLAIAIEEASKCGVKRFGASVADLESARIALTMDCFSMLQLPVHHANLQFLSVIHDAIARGWSVWTNRPFNMGKSLYDVDGNRPLSREQCFGAILAIPFNGIVLTGTGSSSHLRDNMAAFRAARSRLIAGPARH